MGLAMVDIVGVDHPIGVPKTTVSARCATKRSLRRSVSYSCSKPYTLAFLFPKITDFTLILSQSTNPSYASPPKMGFAPTTCVGCCSQRVFFHPGGCGAHTKDDMLGRTEHSLGRTRSVKALLRVDRPHVALPRLTDGAATRQCVHQLPQTITFSTSPLDYAEWRTPNRSHFPLRLARDVDSVLYDQFSSSSAHLNR